MMWEKGKSTAPAFAGIGLLAGATLIAVWLVRAPAPPGGQLTPLPVIWIAGQSNAGGRPHGTNALASLGTIPTNVLLAHEFWPNDQNSGLVSERRGGGGGGLWHELAPLSVGVWGLEMSMGCVLGRGRRRIGILKTTMGSSTLAHDWHPEAVHGRRLYKRALRTWDRAGDELKRAGYAPSWEALVWLQGFGDAGTASSAGAYEGNLRALFTALRRDTGLGTNLALVVARCGLSMTNSRPRAWLDQVRRAQTSVAESTPNSSWIDLDGVAMWETGSDAGVHYSDCGLLVAGYLAASNVMAHARGTTQ